MQPRNPDYKSVVEDIFSAAPFIQSLGTQLLTIEPGRCETRLNIRPEHLQQDGFVHAGIQATLADHTAGCAGYTLAAPNTRLLSAEFKINLLRPAKAPTLRCVGTVIKPGKQLIITQADVYAISESGKETHVSHLIQTLAAASSPSM